MVQNVIRYVNFGFVDINNHKPEKNITKKVSNTVLLSRIKSKDWYNRFFWSNMIKFQVKSMLEPNQRGINRNRWDHTVSSLQCETGGLSQA